MTGFGRGVADHAGVRATVDIRSVNHRFIDLKLRAQVSPALEDAIAAKIKGAVERGAITVSLHLDKPRGGASTIRLDVARVAHAELLALAHELEIAEPDLALVLAQPGVVAAQDLGEPDVAVLAALDLALTQLAAMRASEGRALATELATRLGELAQLRGKIDAIAARVPEQLQKRLHERLRRLLGDDAQVDATRIAQEVALGGERADVTEEGVGGGAHREQARVLVNGRAAAGRRLEFLVQEIGRELNTIGSKSQDAEITSHVVEAKAILEKLREQVQNVE